MQLSSTQDPLGLLGFTAQDRDLCERSETDRISLIHSLTHGLAGHVAVLGWDCVDQTLWFVVRHPPEEPFEKQLEKELEKDLEKHEPTSFNRKTEGLRSLVQNNPPWTDLKLQLHTTLRLKPHHQAIVAVESGQILGHEFGLRVLAGESGTQPGEPTSGLDGVIERLSARLAVQNFTQLGGRGKLFLTVSPRFLHDAGLTPTWTNQWLQHAGISPHRVVLKMVEPIEPDKLKNLTQVLSEFRSFGYEVALEDAAPGSFSLHAIAELQPNYIKVEREFVRDAARHKIKQTLLESLFEFANKISCRLVAAGTESEGPHANGANGAQSGGPEPPMLFAANAPRSIGRSVHGIARSVTTFAADTPVSDVVNYFNDSDSAGIVIVQEERPLGLVMREKLFQRLAFQYGYSLFWNREIVHLMDRDPLMLDEETPLEVASRLSMARDRERTYDLVLVTRGGRLAGVVTIQDLLDTITNAKIELARDANPLTGMPGNRRIEREIERRIEMARPFSIIYTDLDFFKWYNDQFGFQKGDLVINFTAGLLSDVVGKLGQSDDFIGHIGGDDFIIVTHTETPSVLCDSIINRFDGEISRLYPDFGRHIGSYEVTDRIGNKVPASGIAISLSILDCPHPQGTSMECISAESGRLKKIAKEQVGSVCVKGVLEPL